MLVEKSYWDGDEWKDTEGLTDGERIAYYILSFNDIVLIEELGRLHIWDNGVFTNLKDITINFRIKMAMDVLNEGLKDKNRIKYSVTLRNEVVLHLGYNILSLECFDQHPQIVNCKNGLVDLLDFEEFKTHFPYGDHYLSLVQIPIIYDKEALCPSINKFLIDVFGSDRIAFIYEIIGYLLYTSVILQKSFIFFGEPGCGKTTFFDMLKMFLGRKNWTDVSIYNLNKPFQKANLKDKLANIHDELPVKKLNYIENYKEAVTNFYLTGGLKFVQGSITWKNFCKQLNSCNKLPIMSVDTGTDFWRRIILIHCTNYIEKSERDIHILKKITSPEELSGLLGCAVFHFKHLLNRGHFLERFDNIDTVQGIWQINVNPLKLFLDTNCSLIETEREETHFFRSQVNAFRKEKSAMPISQNLISRKLKDLGITQVKKGSKGNQKKYYKGIKINTVHLDGKINLDKILVGVDSATLPKKILDTFGEEIKF